MNDRDHKTYNGYTNNPSKRLRQHNGDISGGAKFTTRHTKKEKDRGIPRHQWSFLAIIESPQFTHHTALSCEWHIKHPTGKRQRPKEYNGADGRLRSLPLVFAHPKFRDMSFVLHVHENYYERTRGYFAAAKEKAAASAATSVEVTCKPSPPVLREVVAQKVEKTNDGSSVVSNEDSEDNEDKDDANGVDEAENDYVIGVNTRVEAFSNVRIVVLAT